VDVWRPAWNNEHVALNVETRELRILLGFCVTVDEDEDHENSHGEILMRKAEGAVVEHPTEARHIIGTSQPLKDFQSGLICRCFCYIQIAEGCWRGVQQKP